MKTFSGFPSGKVPIVGIPRSVFTELMPLIDDLAELKLTLHILWRLSEQQGEMRYLRFADLTSDGALLASLETTSGGREPAKTLRSALIRAVERGTLLRAEAGKGRKGDTLYFANSAKGRAAVEAISRGERPEEIETRALPNIFALYEQNIGMLTPLIVDELKEAEQTYPAAWIEEAFREAVSLNKRSWRYIRAILERWMIEGKGRQPEKRTAEAERRRYLEWKNG